MIVKYCIDCGSLLGNSAFYCKNKRCKKCNGIKNRKRKVIICPVCKNTFERIYSHLGKTSTCSKKCFSILKRKLKYIQDMTRMKKDYLQYKKYLKTINPVILGWIVGFWEGEGCIEIHKNTKYNCMITIAQKELTSLYRVQKILKAGTVSKIRYKNINMGRYGLYTSGKILALIEIFLKNITGRGRIQQLRKIYNNLKKIKCY